MTTYSVIEKGRPYTKDYAVYFVENRCNTIVSPFHDIPLRSNSTESNLFNMVVEIPRWTNAKMEINKEAVLNPIKQDVKKGKMRFVNNCFPYHGFIYNYGAFPQTWEDPSEKHKDTGLIGDNDPLDVCELGSKIFKRGEVISVKVLGIIGLIDEGETDWKILAIHKDDPLASKLNDVEDINCQMPGYLQAIIDWLRIYKVPTGKDPNKFAFKDRLYKDKLYALQIVEEAHKQWQHLIDGKSNVNGIACSTTTLKDKPGYMSEKNARDVVAQMPDLMTAAEIPSEVDEVYFPTSRV